jgi:hypothetical protein
MAQPCEGTRHVRRCAQAMGHYSSGDRCRDGERQQRDSNGERVRAARDLGEEIPDRWAHLAAMAAKENWSEPTLLRGLGRLMDSSNDEKRITYTQAFFIQHRIEFNLKKIT